MRDTPAGLIEELREAAHLDAIELGVDRAEMPAHQAADYIEHLRRALGRIEAGAPDPAAVAREALDVGRWLGGSTEPPG